MKRIVTSILGVSLLTGSLYAAGAHSSQERMMNHSDMKEHIVKCEKLMKSTADENTWTPPRNILLELDQAIDNG